MEQIIARIKEIREKLHSLKQNDYDLSFGFRTSTCPVCGKKFCMKIDCKDWAWKARPVAKNQVLNCCSYNCMRVIDKLNDEYKSLKKETYGKTKQRRNS